MDNKEHQNFRDSIATIDEEGFICITDRLNRFGKIGGEMVPYVKIEEMLNDIIDATEPVCVVTSVRDEKKGEKLVVLYEKNINIDEVWNKMIQTELPNLWIPRKENFYKIDKIPYLGTGKFDLRGIRNKAQLLAV